MVDELKMISSRNAINLILDREEDSQLYIEYADVMKFYEAILDFMDRAFRLEPSISTKP